MPAPMPVSARKRYVFQLGMSAALLAGLLQPALLHAEQQGLTVETEIETETEVEPVSGTVLSVPEEDSASAQAKPISLPTHGLSMTDVERRYGSPRAKHAAVGKPPITRWDYDGFSVFFEYHTVLHAVRPDAPAPIQRKDELIGGKSSSEPAATPDSSTETP